MSFALKCIFLDDDIDVSLWKITSTLIEQVCLLLNDDIKLFWNVCKIYFEDRLSVIPTFLLNSIIYFCLGARKTKSS